MVVTYLASSVRAMIPEAIGVAALVPVKDSQSPSVVVVTYEGGGMRVACVN